MIRSRFFLFAGMGICSLVGALLIVAAANLSHASPFFIRAADPPEVRTFTEHITYASLPMMRQGKSAHIGFYENTGLLGSRRLSLDRTRSICSPITPFASPISLPLTAPAGFWPYRAYAVPWSRCPR